MQCVACSLLVIVLLIISRLYSMLKDQCLIFEPTRKADSFINQKPVFTLEVMQLRLLTDGLILVTLLTIVRDDGADISFRRNSMVGQINNVLCYFSQIGAVPKLTFLK